MPYELCVKSSFSSAHQIPGYEGNCENLHGHNWEVEVCVEAESLNEIGIAIDFRALKDIIDQIISTVDHKLLNDHPYFKTVSPTSENIAFWFYNKIKEKLEEAEVKIKKVKVWENAASYASYSE